MQREKKGTTDSYHPGSLFDSFGGFGSHRSMISSIFGGRDPFDDAFFNRPFGNMFGIGSSIFDSHGSSDDFPFGSSGDLPRISSSKGPVIEELGTDDEGEQGEEGNSSDSGVKEEKPRKSSRASKEPLVEHPDDQDEKSKEVQQSNIRDRNDERHTQTRSVSFRKVTYGGVDGAYYSATTSRKTGSDGVVLEESKQADRTTGQATHRISRGIQDKGHSFTRKLNTDGKVDSVQTLHNLNEDELAGFEQAWKGNVNRHFPGWNEVFNSYGNTGTSGTQTLGFSLPFADHFGRASGTRQGNEAGRNSSQGRAKKVVRVNIE